VILHKLAIAGSLLGSESLQVATSTWERVATRCERVGRTEPRKKELGM
jgi:hypothetical protein